MAVILFDGVCNLCSGSVRFVIARDPARIFKFAPLSSEAAARLLHGANAPTPLPDSMVLVEEDGRVFTRSIAALRIARRLRFPWWTTYGLIVIPTAFRDAVYDYIARHRYRWFGKQDTCLVPGPALRDRFLE